MIHTHAVFAGGTDTQKEGRGGSWALDGISPTGEPAPTTTNPPHAASTALCPSHACSFGLPAPTPTPPPPPNPIPSTNVIPRLPGQPCARLDPSKPTRPTAAGLDRSLGAWSMGPCPKTGERKVSFRRIRQSRPSALARLRLMLDVWSCKWWMDDGLVMSIRGLIWEGFAIGGREGASGQWGTGLLGELRDKAGRMGA